MRIVAFVPAKGRSDRIPNKNLALLDGKPLVLHTIEKLTACDFIDEVYLDSESEEVLSVADHLPVRRMRRDPALAGNETDGHALFMNEVAHTEADIYIQALCTSPFIEPATIQKAVETLTRSAEYDSATLVRREHLYVWQDGRPAYGTGRIPNSVDLPWTTIESMGLYVVPRSTALKHRRRFGDRPLLLEATPIETIDVNTPAEFALANLIASGKRERERHFLRSLQSQLTSALLSDILDHMGVRGVVTGLAPNLPGARVLGRAKTLKLRRLRPGESPEGIYAALDSYRTIVPNDVIVVETEAPEYAYFGDLNAALAIRAGAVGALINGRTRDANKVLDLRFPVFARGTHCTDARGRLTVETINRPIRLDGVDVLPSDLVFADPDGVVVVPRRIEAAVLSRAVESLEKESRIAVAIALGTDVDEIIRQFGAF